MIRAGPIASAAAGLLLAACGERSTPRFAAVPGGTYELGSRDPASLNPPRQVELRPFRIASRETTVAEYAEYLNRAGMSPGIVPHPDLVRRGGRWDPAPGRAGLPVAHVTRDEAEAYCAWISRTTGRRVRLPTEDEWEAAARGGIRGAPWPWGWGDPASRAVLNVAGPAVAGSRPPNPNGLHDACGNVFEWCTGGSQEGIPARGGAWSERDPAMGTVHRRTVFRPDYRGADTGFRVVSD